jgi:hypothetical protein
VTFAQHLHGLNLYDELQFHLHGGFPVSDASVEVRCSHSSLEGHCKNETGHKEMYMVWSVCPSILVFLPWSYLSLHYISVARFFLQSVLPISIMADTAKQTSHGPSKPMLGHFSPQTLQDSSTLRKHLVAAGGEFIGTFLFLFGNYSLLRRYYLSLTFDRT